jgi:hypothetical protein
MRFVDSEVEPSRSIGPIAGAISALTLSNRSLAGEV